MTSNYKNDFSSDEEIEESDEFDSEEEIEEISEEESEVEKEDWTDIHKDFVEEYYDNKTYQQCWEEEGFTYEEAKKWIEIYFYPYDLENIKNWLDYDFTLEQVKEWINAGLENKEADLAIYLQEKGYSPERFAEEFGYQRDAQEWVSFFYPDKEITELDIERRNLTGELDLSEFINLENLNCSFNELTNLIIDNCFRLETVDCSYNQLTDLDVSNQPKLTDLDCSSNLLTKLNTNDNLQLTRLECDACQLTTLEVSNCKNLFYLICRDNQLTDLTTFSQLENLETLWLHDNPLVGSLETLKNLKKLRELWIENTNIIPDWEYLPKNLKELGIRRFSSKFKNNDFSQELQLYKRRGEDVRYDLQLWRQNQLGYKNLQQTLFQISPNLNIQEFINQFDFFNVKTGEFQGDLNSLLFFSQNFQEKINFLETIIQQLKKSIQELQTKIEITLTKALSSFVAEQELMQELVNKHLEFVKAKQQGTNSYQLKKQLRKIEDELEENLGEELMEKVQSTLNDCEKLVEQLWQLELLTNISSSVEFTKQEGLTITFVINNNFNTLDSHNKNSNLLEDESVNKLALHQSIGRGAFGEVYLGKYQGQEVAVKKLDISFNFLDKENLVMIKNELDLLNKLKHPNIIKFLASQQEGSDLLIIIEYANEGSLADYINNQNKDNEHDWKLNYQFILGMTQGLAYLHKQNIVHRDLKSANILLSNQVAKLADFGLSKAKTFQTSVGSHNAVGTIRWLAPEIIVKNQPHSFETDIYSLGMIFWEIAAKCTKPFSDTEDCFIINKHFWNEKETIPNKTPAILKEIIEGCWKEKPEERVTLEEIGQKINQSSNQGTKRKAEEQLIKNDNKQLTQSINKIILHQIQPALSLNNQPTLEDWKNINLNFTPEWVQVWINYGFNYWETKAWIDIGMKVDQVIFCTWLRDLKKVDAEWVLNYGNMEELNQEFSQWWWYNQYQTQIEIPPQ